MEDLHEIALEENRQREILIEQKRQEIDAVRRQLGQYNSVYAKFQNFGDGLKLFTDKNVGVTGRLVMLSGFVMQAGQALMSLRDKIYELQAKLGTTFDTAISAGAGALMNVVSSYFGEGPQLGFQDTINAINAYQQEFGTLLTAGAAKDFAQTAKKFGTDFGTLAKAQRSFLGAGGISGQATIQREFVTQFRAAGLTANQALVFAANNANLVAIAGVKYADSLARAAANATRIGVSLDKTEQFADNIVGDFEGALERFSELRAMGVDVDFNRIAGIAATGTPEEIVNELSREFGGNRRLLEEVQRNRFLKVAIEKDLGLSIADVKKLAGMGGETVPTEKNSRRKN